MAWWSSKPEKPTDPRDLRSEIAPEEGKLISVEPDEPPPQPGTAGKNIRAIIRRRTARYERCQKAELVVWVWLSDAAQAILRSTGFLNCSLLDIHNTLQDIPASTRELIDKGELSFDNFRLVQFGLSDYFLNKPFFMRNDDPLLLDKYAQEIKQNLKNLSDRIERSGRPPSSEEIEL